MFCHGLIQDLCRCLWAVEAGKSWAGLCPEASFFTGRQVDPAWGRGQIQEDGILFGGPQGGVVQDQGRDGIEDNVKGG